MHGGNFMAMAVDFVLLRLPWRIEHMSYPILSGLAYAIFSFSYYQLGGVNRYGFSIVLYRFCIKKMFNLIYFSGTVILSYMKCWIGGNHTKHSRFQFFV